MDWLFVADLVRESFNQVNELLLFLLLLGTTLSIELSLSEKQATQSYLKPCFHFFNPEGLLEWLLPAFIEERVENLTENAAVEELLEIFNGDESRRRETVFDQFPHLSKILVPCPPFVMLPHYCCFSKSSLHLHPSVFIYCSRPNYPIKKTM